MTGGPEPAFAAFLVAMQRGDTSALQALIAPSFTLTHITGLVQPGHRWLEGIRTGEFLYHRIELLELIADGSHLTARTLTDARVYGSRATWPLQLDLDYLRRGAEWIAQSAVAQLWR